MKKLWILPLALVALLLPSCASPTAAAQDADPNPGLSVPAVVDATPVVDTAPESAQPSFEATLAYVREEEKLARDVYRYLADVWNLNVFSNIAESEETHTNTIRTLLDAYGLNDPAEGLAPGGFADASLQALYNELTARGSLSLAEALKVGAAIEEIDILDLQSRLTGELPADVSLALQNLLTGSYNHLVAFTSTLQRQTGEVYIPQYMTQDAYQAALLGTNTAGAGGGNGYRGGQP